MATAVLFIWRKTTDQRENQHAAASCDLKQKIKAHRELSGSGALADQHSSGGNGADRQDSLQHSAISIQPRHFLQRTQSNSTRSAGSEHWNSYRVASARSVDRQAVCRRRK